MFVLLAGVCYFAPSSYFLVLVVVESASENINTSAKVVCVKKNRKKERFLYPHTHGLINDIINYNTT